MSNAIRILSTRWMPGLVALIVLMGLEADAQTRLDLSNADPDFQPRRVLGPLPTITEFPTVPVAKADRTLNPSELVIGVTVNGESRAYPINMLTGPRREILNDILGGRPIAATW